MRDQKFPDLQLTHFSENVKRIQLENSKQLEKWGVQEATVFEWLAWLGEEYGEFVQAINEFVYRNGSLEAVIQEGIQAATLLMKLIETVEHSSIDSEKWNTVPGRAFRSMGGPGD